MQEKGHEFFIVARDKDSTYQLIESKNIKMTFTMSNFILYLLFEMSNYGCITITAGNFRSTINDR
jgi:predicted glycosyltransferase